MFDLDYKPENGTFIPYIRVIAKGQGAECEEEIQSLSGVVAGQGEAVVENAAAIAENSNAITENAAAIEGEIAAREGAVGELNERINNIPKFEVEVVESLPDSGYPGTIYLVKDTGKDTYSEYMFVNGAWEKLGSDVVLSEYVTKTELETALSDFYSKDEADERFLTEHQDISSLATKQELSEKADSDTVYTKEESDAKYLTEHQDISGLASKEEMNQVLDTKANAEDVYNKAETDGLVGAKVDICDVYSKDEIDTMVSSFSTKEEVSESIASVEAVANSAVAAASVVASELADEVSAREQAILGLHEEIIALPKFKILVVNELPESGDAATLYLVATGDETENVYTEYVYVNNSWEEIGTQSLDLSDYAKTTDLDALSGTVEDVVSELESVDEKLVGLAEANARQDDVIATKADSDDVYTKVESDAKFITEHQDISGLASKAEVESVDAKVDAIDLTPYAESTAVTAEIAAASSVLAAKDAEQDDAIALKANAADVYNKTEDDELFATKVNQDVYDAFYKDYIAVKKLVGGTGANVSWSASTKSELTDLLGNGGGTVNLMRDITEEDGWIQYTTPTFGSPTKTLNLRNHDIITSGRNDACMFLLRADQELTITGGNITNTNTKNSSSDENTLHNPVFIAKGNSILNLSLGASKSATTLSIDPVVVCQENATINIKSGNYSTPDVCLIYCMNGTINITGGSFRSTADPAGYLINCLDASYIAGTANIVISSTSKTSGPKFYDFNPADCGSEGEHTNFVAEGCEVKVTTETIDEVEHTVYTVVKSA